MIEKLAPYMWWVMPIMQNNNQNEAKQFVHNMLMASLGFIAFVVVLAMLVVIIEFRSGRLNTVGFITAILGGGSELSPFIKWLDIIVTYGGILVIIHLVVSFLFGASIADAMWYFINELRSMLGSIGAGGG